MLTLGSNGVEWEPSNTYEDSEMQDGIMYTWDVIYPSSHGYGRVFQSSRKELAEYVCDWCNALVEDRCRQIMDNYEKGWFNSSHILFQGEPSLERLLSFQENYSVTESEVVL